MASPNYSLYAVPAYIVLAMFPHAYAISTIKSANNGRWDNSNPRSPAYNEKIQKSVPAAIFSKFERAEAAHKNGMENLAIFCTTIILGNMAQLPTSTLNTVAAAYLALRFIYNIVYIHVTTPKYSYLRTAIYFASTSLCLYQIVRAANVFSSRSDI